MQNVYKIWKLSGFGSWIGIFITRILYIQVYTYIYVCVCVCFRQKRKKTFFFPSISVYIGDLSLFFLISTYRQRRRRVVPAEKQRFASTWKISSQPWKIVARNAKCAKFRTAQKSPESRLSEMTAKKKTSGQIQRFPHLISRQKGRDDHARPRAANWLVARPECSSRQLWDYYFVTYLSTNKLRENRSVVRSNRRPFVRLVAMEIFRWFIPSSWPKQLLHLSPLSLLLPHSLSLSHARRSVPSFPLVFCFFLRESYRACQPM